MSIKIGFGRLVRSLAAAAAIGLAGAATPAAAAEHNYAALVMDANTGRVLFSRNADAQRFPASLTKMMTVYLIFEDIEAGRIRLNTRLNVSANAAAQAPTKLGLRAGQTISVQDAILALITKSANDVAMVVAENLAGSEAAFARRATATARALGMSRTTFRNPHGLPNSGQVTTARDMARLGLALQDRFPQHYAYFSTRSFTWNGQRIGNHNNLLRRLEGVDGIKTGYTRASGFNLVTSIRRDGRHLVAVVMGGNTAASRDAHMVQLIERYLPRASRGARTAPLVVASAIATEIVPPTPRSRPFPVSPMVTASVPAAAAAAVAPPAALAEPAQGDVDDGTTVATDGWKIQIGALPTREAADRVLSSAVATAPDLLRPLTPYTEPVNSRGSTLYRARFAGFSDAASARAACAQLERRDFACLALQH